jgi:UDP-3-O-[3-hydroxymyristoyl] glucosamine N-acyltransferase
VSRSIREPGVYSGALPMDEAGRWRRNAARFRQLDALVKRLGRLERSLGEQDEAAGGTPGSDDGEYEDD